jgi:hypothetical protein
VADTRSRRRRTHLWFVFYTAVLLVVVAISVADHQWSVAGTGLAIAIVFALFTRRLWRRR